MTDFFDNWLEQIGERHGMPRDEVKARLFNEGTGVTTVFTTPCCRADVRLVHPDDALPVVWSGVRCPCGLSYTVTLDTEDQQREAHPEAGEAT